MTPCAGDSAPDALFPDIRQNPAAYEAAETFWRELLAEAIARSSRLEDWSFVDGAGHPVPPLDEDYTAIMGAYRNDRTRSVWIHHLPPDADRIPTIYTEHEREPEFITPQNQLTLDRLTVVANPSETYVPSIRAVISSWVNDAVPPDRTRQTLEAAYDRFTQSGAFTIDEG